jgi:hypothetical protein
MYLSSYWEANSDLATQEFPEILWNPEIHYRVHKSPPLVPILSQSNTVHSIPSYLSLRFILVLSPTYVEVFLMASFLWLSHQNPICIPLLPMGATRPARLILYDLVIQIMLREENKSYEC